MGQIQGFWIDGSILECLLCDRLSRLFGLVNDKNVSVALMFRLVFQ